jgi:hypothetical protein
LTSARLPPRQLDLGLLGHRAQPHHRQVVAAHVGAQLGQAHVGHVLHQELVDVVAAEERVAGGGQHLVDLILQPQERHVEGAAAEVVDRDQLRELARVAVGQGRRGRLVEHPHHRDPGDRAGGRGRRPLGVVEAGRHRHDRAVDLAAQGLGRHAAHVIEDDRRDLRHRELAAAGDDHRLLVRALLDLVRHALHRRVDLARAERPPDQPLGRVDRVARIDDAPLLGLGADHHRAVRVERHHRRMDLPALVIGQHHRRAAGVAAGRDRVGRAQVDADDRIVGGRRHAQAPALEARTSSYHRSRARRNGHIQPYAGPMNCAITWSRYHRCRG